MATAKTYQYKVFSSAGVYIGLWNEVISDFSLTEEINSAGGQVVVQLGRPVDSFSEGVDVDFNLRVDIYCYDAEAPNGTRVFSGYITSYIPVEGDDEYIQINLYGYGALLDGYMLEEDIPTIPFFETVDFSHNSAKYMGKTSWAAQSFYMTGDNFTQVIVGIDWDDVSFPHPPATTGTVECALYSDNAGKPGSALSSWVTDSISVSHIFDFSDNPVAVVDGRRYWVVFRATGASVEGYIIRESIGDSDPTGSQFRSDDSGTTWYYYEAGGGSGTGNDIIINVYNDNYDTSIAYLSEDPGAIMRDVMDRYNRKGGVLTYDASTIELTGTEVSYTFNTNTILEAIKKCLELAPAGWYWYVDQSTNMVHFHTKNTVEDHKFLIGKDITNLNAEKRSEDIANTIYFTGGGTPPFFKRYKNLASIDAFGPRVKRYIDQRVELEATAATIADALLDQVKVPELRLNFEIVDSNFANDGNGYDIESIAIGDMMGVRNIEGSLGPALWDIDFWDTDYWDYNLADLTSPLLQIVRIERGDSGAKIFCSTVPPDVSKRIEDINRNLEASQTFDNPSAPE